jgi:hypothetical protein
MICASIDVIVQAARLRDGSRRITHITEVMGMEGDTIITQDIFLYDLMGEDLNGNIIGRHRSTGIGRPKFWERARYYGEEKRLAAALDAAEVADIENAAMDMQTLALAFLTTVTVGGLAWVFIYPLLSGEKQAEKRRASFARAEPTALRVDDRARAPRSSRGNHEGAGAAARQSQKLTIDARISQAGLVDEAAVHDRLRRTGAVVMFAAFFGGVPLLPAIGFAFAAVFGLPRWLLAFSRSAVKRSFSMPCQMPST